jgi:hypothetical protein
MTIVPVEKLDLNDLDLLGDNVTEAIRIDHDAAAVHRSLACHEVEPVKQPRVRTPGRRVRRPR